MAKFDYFRRKILDFWADKKIEKNAWLKFFGNFIFLNMYESRIM